MSIDFFTLVAQIINLIILLFLLRKFLYLPVLKAVDERQKFIEGELKKAASSHKKAVELEQECQRQMAEIEIERQKILAQTKFEAGELANRLSNEAKAEFEAAKKQWKSKLKSEQKTFDLAIQNLVVEHFNTFAADALKQMADIGLNDLIIEKFKEEIAGLPVRKKQSFAAAYRQKKEILVQSAKRLSAEQQRGLEQFLREEFALSAEIKFKFAVDGRLVCGIALWAEEQLISWNLASYLTTFEKNMKQEVSELVNRG